MIVFNGKPLFDAGKFYDVKFIKYITVEPSLNGSVNLSRYSGAQGDVVTAFAVPDQHYTFDSYGITGAELTGSMFTIGADDIQIQGNFVPKVYNVSYYNDGNGTLTGNLTTATANMTGTLTATPNSHYLFGNYAVTGGSIDGNILTVTGNCSAKVYFAAEPKYNITLSQQVGGSVSADKTTAYSGDIVTLSNTPSAHYDFMNYSLTGAVLTGSQFRMNNQNVTARANFSAWPVRNLTLTQQTGGTITANKTTGYDGDTVTLSNTTSSDYYFNNWLITGATLTGNSFKFNGSNVTVKASYEYNHSDTNSAKRYDYRGTNMGNGNSLTYSLFKSWPDGTTQTTQQYTTSPSVRVTTATYYAFKSKIVFSSKPSSLSGLYSNCCGGPFTGVSGPEEQSFNVNYLPIWDKYNCLVTYSSNKIVWTGDNGRINDPDWTTAGKIQSVIVSSNGSKRNISSYYDGELLVAGSANTNYSLQNYLRMGIYKYRSSAHTTGEKFDNKERYYDVYKNSGYGQFQYRCFSSLKDASAYAIRPF